MHMPLVGAPGEGIRYGEAFVGLSLDRDEPERPAQRTFASDQHEDKNVETGKTGMRRSAIDRINGGNIARVRSAPPSVKTGGQGSIAQARERTVA